MAQVYTVTASTSIVLISTLQSPNTIVLLSSISYPGHIVGIRDITGDPSITARPIIVSTTTGISFADGTISTLINQPNGYLSLSSKNPTTWQQLNTVGFLTGLSNAYLENLTISNGFITSLSSIQGQVSTVNASQVNVLNSINILGNTEIQGKVIVDGGVNIFSSMFLRDDLYLSSAFTVNENVFSQSSLRVLGPIVVQGSISTNESLTANFVSVSSLQTNGILVSRFLSTQRIETKNVYSQGGMKTMDSLSVGKDLEIGGNFYVSGQSLFVGNSLFQSSLYVRSDLSIDENLSTKLTILNKNLAIGENLNIVGNVSVSEQISSLGTIRVGKNTYNTGQVLIKGDTEIFSSTITRNAVFKSTGYVTVVRADDNISVRGSLEVQDTAAIFQSSLFIEGNTSIASNIQVNALTSFSSFFSSYFTSVKQGSISSANIYVKGNAIIKENSIHEYNSFTVVPIAYLSTSYFSTIGDSQIFGTLEVKQNIFADVLGAPVSKSISTVRLSNTFQASNITRTLSIETTQNPKRIVVGSGTPNLETLFVNGNLFASDSINQTSNVQFDTPLQTNKNIYANNAYYSSIRMPYLMSSFLVGDSNLIGPYSNMHGYVVVGSNTIGSNHLWFSTDLSNWYTGIASFPGGFPKKVATNGRNFWVVVGSSSDSNYTIQWSEDGIRWYPSFSGGFETEGNDVVVGSNNLGNEVWVAVGVGTSTIKYSTNGKTWRDGSNRLFTTAGTSLAYNRFFYAIGNDLPNFGFRYSQDGETWNNIMDPSGYNLLPTTALGSSSSFPTPGFLLVANENEILRSIDYGSNFIYISTINFTSTTRFSFAYGKSNWVSVGCNSPTEAAGVSINFSGDGLSWSNVIDAYQNGLTGTFQKIIFDPISDQFLAVGDMSTISDVVLTTSPDGLSWTRKTIFPGTAYGIAAGNLDAPIQKNFATINLTTIFTGAVSSVSLTVSSLQASTIRGNFFGDGSLISNVSAFDSNIITSTIESQSVKSFQMDTLANVRQVLSSQVMNIENNMNVYPQIFLSSISLTLAGGIDSLSSGMIQYSYEPGLWTPVGRPTFSLGCTGLLGNGKSTLADSFFVAVGGDTRTDYTIQWSTDGSNWFPSESGGFSNGLVGNVKRGNSVAYNKNLNPPFGRWLVSGEDSTGYNTVKYSDDGKNWINGVNGPRSNAFYMTTLKNGTQSLCYNIGYDPGGAYYFANFFHSLDGINWTDRSNANTPLVFAQVAVGPLTTGTVENKEQFVYSYNPGITIQFADPDVLPLVFTDQKCLFTGCSFIAGLSNIYFADPYWVSFGSNMIYYTSSFTNVPFPVFPSWPTWQSSILNSQDIALKTLNYNSNTGLWTAGTASLYSNQTIWYSYDRFNWLQIASGGFTTNIGAFGKGYCVAPTYNTNSYNYAGGTGAFNEFSGLDSQIFLTGNFGDGRIGARVYLTESNAATVFKSQVRGIYSAYGLYYSVVAVGDGDTPQKTIARAGESNFFVNNNRWVPIITGGFSTIGYGVTLEANTGTYRWIAVGESDSVLNTIQISKDTANWYGVNNANALRQGGRGVATNYIAIVAVGKDSNTSNTIVYSPKPFNTEITPNFSAIASSGFSVQGNGIASGFLRTSGGSLYAGFIAVGQDADPLRTILRSGQAGPAAWSPVVTGGFNIAGYGIGYALIYNSNTGNFVETWIAVGEDSDPLNTIQISYDGINFTNTGITNPFTKAGYAVAYTNDDYWIAVGEDAQGNERGTIKLSIDGLTWRPLDWRAGTTFGSYFKSEVQTGQALSIYTQQYAINESFPYLNFPNLIFYERYSSRSYSKPTIRTTSSNIYLNETLQMNQSNQIVIGYPVTFTPYNTSTLLTVNGGILTSSLFLEGSLETLGSNAYFKNITVSSFYNQKSATFSNLLTPSLSINARSAANNIEFLYRSTSLGTTSQFTKLTGIQKTMYISCDLLNRDYVSIGISTAYQNIVPELYVEGTTVFSTLSTAYLSIQSTLSLQLSNGFSLETPYVQFFQGSTSLQGISTNTVRTDFSSMTINNVMSLNISTQKIGIFNSNPLFDMDVRINSVINSLSTPINLSSRLFLTLQSV